MCKGFSNFRSIQFSDCKEAKGILDRISKRKLYKLLAYVQSEENLGVTAKEAEAELSAIIHKGLMVTPNDLAVVSRKIKMPTVFGTRKPMENVIFIDKKVRWINFYFLYYKYKYRVECLLLMQTS